MVSVTLDSLDFSGKMLFPSWDVSLTAPGDDSSLIFTLLLTGNKRVS
jgi:hypothetical protein